MRREIWIKRKLIMSWGLETGQGERVGLRLQISWQLWVKLFLLQLKEWLRWLRICLQWGRPGFDPWIRKIPWRREWQPTPVFLPGEFHGQRGLAGCSPWGFKELDTTELRMQKTLKIENQTYIPSWEYALGRIPWAGTHALFVFSEKMKT